MKVNLKNVTKKSQKKAKKNKGQANGEEKLISANKKAISVDIHDFMTLLILLEGVNFSKRIIFP